MTMRKTWLSLCAVCILAAPAAVCGQSQPERDNGAKAAGLPIARLIEIVARQTGKTFIVDPRVRAEVTLIGEAPEKISYADFLAVLQLHDFVAIESGKLIRILPAQSARTWPSPIVTGGETRPDAEYVTKIIPVRTMSALTLVPVLRPLLPMQAHFVALTCANVLIISDTFGNARRIERLVQSLDKGEPYQPEKCQAREPATP